jgi:intron-binding protein aquarius
MFPTSRLLEEDAKTSEIVGVEHLGQYVFEMTQAKASVLKAGNSGSSARGIPVADGLVTDTFSADVNMEEADTAMDEGEDGPAEEPRA